MRYTCSGGVPRNNKNRKPATAEAGPLCDTRAGAAAGASPQALKVAATKRLSPP